MAVKKKPIEKEDKKEKKVTAKKTVEKKVAEKKTTKKTTKKEPKTTVKKETKEAVAKKETDKTVKKTKTKKEVTKKDTEKKTKKVAAKKTTDKTVKKATTKKIVKGKKRTEYINALTDKLISKHVVTGKTKIDTRALAAFFFKDNIDITSAEFEDIKKILKKNGIEVIEKAEIGDYKIENIKVNPTTDDSVKLYLSDIGRYDLIDQEKEIELAKRILPGLKAREILNPIFEEEERIFKEVEKECRSKGILQRSEIRKIANKKIAEANLIDPKKREKLEKDFDDGLDARNELINANLRLVISIAKRYVGRGLPFMDVIQEGNLGLQKAAEKFDHTKGFKFSTYATWWIRQSITRAIADYSRAIRVPVHKWEDINKLEKTRKRLTQTLERAATIEEIAEELGWPEKTVLETLRASQDVVSIDTPIGEEGDSTLADFVEDENTEAPDDIVEKGILRDRLLELLYELDPRETQVLIMRYGFDDGRTKTLEEVGKAFDVTRERVRQIEARAFKKLRQKLEQEKDKSDDFRNMINKN